MLKVDVCDLVPDRELERVVFVFADQVEETSADIDISRRVLRTH